MGWSRILGKLNSILPGTLPSKVQPPNGRDAPKPYDVTVTDFMNSVASSNFDPGAEHTVS